jgi:uncharacterized protein YqjF (DUF2071 family)
MAITFNHPAFSQIEHRPWPLPNKKWLLTQTWLNLLFVHWEIDVSDLRARIPDELEIDLHNGKAYIAIVPFDMKGVTFRNCPKVSFLSDFPEINVRTYVTYQGKPGVWFFSLDVPRRFPAWAARTFFHLPYRHGQVSIADLDGEIHYKQEVENNVFRARYKPFQGCIREPSSFEKWATERYCLYCQSKYGSLYRTEVQHRLWPLQKASLDIEKNSMLSDFEVGLQHPSILFSKRIEVVAYALERLN